MDKLIVKCSGCGRNTRVKKDILLNEVFCGKCKNKKPCSRCREYAVSKESNETMCKKCKKVAIYRHNRPWVSPRTLRNNKRQDDFFRDASRSFDR